MSCMHIIRETVFRRLRISRQYILFCRETFEVCSKVVPVSLAYTAGHLGFHTDSSYFDFAPGVMLAS